MAENPAILVIAGKDTVSVNLRENLNSMGYRALVPALPQESGLRATIPKEPDLILMDITQRRLQEGFGRIYKILSKADIPILFLGAGPEKILWNRMSNDSVFSQGTLDFERKDLKFRIDRALRYHKKMQQLPPGKRPRWDQLCKMGEAVLFTDKNGIVSFMNSTAQFLFGWKLKKAVGHHFQKVSENSFDKDEELFLNILERTLQNEVTLFLTENIPTGKGDRNAIRNVITSSIKDERGITLGAVLAVTHLFHDKRRTRLAFNKRSGDKGNGVPVVTLCPWCKATRDKNEKWTTIEHYIASYLSRNPEHCICPNCLQRLTKGIENIIG